MITAYLHILAKGHIFFKKKKKDVFLLSIHIIYFLWINECQMSKNVSFITTHKSIGECPNNELPTTLERAPTSSNFLYMLKCILFISLFKFTEFKYAGCFKASIKQK